MKPISGLFSIPAIILLLLVQAGLSAPCRAQDAEPTVTWKIATLAPKGVAWSKHAEDIIYPSLEAACQGRLKAKVYWGGVMGDDEDCLEKMKKGILQGAALSSQGAIQACPEFSVVELPFLFNSYGEVDYVRKKMFPAIAGLFEKHGYKLGAWLDQDFDPIVSTEFPIATLADFSRARFGTSHGALEEALLNALGAENIHLEVPEARTALTKLRINAAIAPLVFLVGAQMHGKVRYITPVNIRYSPAVTTLSLDAWNALPKDCRQALDIENKRLYPDLNQMIRETNQKFLKAFFRYGIIRTDMTLESYRRIKKKASKVNREMAGHLYPGALLKEINAHLKVFRGQNGDVSLTRVPLPDLDYSPPAAKKGK